jgi:CRISPR-associated protein (Cas_Cmr5)
MLKKIEYLIPAAIKAVDAVLVKGCEKQGGISEGYQAAASGFAITLHQMGLMPTLAVYTDKGSQAEIDRKLLLETLIHIVSDASSRYGGKENLPKADEKGGRADKILRHMVGLDDNNRDSFKLHLVQAATAFKLAIRTYPLKSNKS